MDGVKQTWVLGFAPRLSHTSPPGSEVGGVDHFTSEPWHSGIIVLG